jgi:hypothetical protein
MRHLRTIAFLLLALAAMSYSTNPETTLAQKSTGVGASFKGPVGLQLYSLRDSFAKDVPTTLDQVKAFGIKYVETAGTYGLTPQKFRAELDARGLKAVSGHFGYELCRDHIEDVARDAKYSASSTWAARGSRTRIHSMRKPVAKQRRCSTAPAKHWLSMG